MVGFVVAAIAVLGLCALLSRVGSAHCDTLNGPVVTTAKEALEKGDVTPVLKWVEQEHEGEIKEAFQKALTVRTKGPEARELADMYFFETLVRIHRAGEGAPYTGLKDEPVEPVVAAADKSLETGSVDALVKTVTDRAAEGIRERFAQVQEKKKHANDSVQAGREFVEAYVEYTHYVERLHADAAGHAGHEAETHGADTEGGHAH